MSSALQQLAAAKPLTNLPGARVCAHPGRPAQLLRQRTTPDDVCVELLVGQEGPFPCCVLPHTPPVPGGQAKGLFSLIALEGLDEGTLVNRLAAVEGQVTTACAGCPGPQRQRQAAEGQEAGPSPLVYSPQFSAFLERCLELAQMHKGQGPAPAVLLLQIVSRLGYATAPQLREPFLRNFYLPLVVLLEAAVELHGEAITPQVSLAIWESWARMGRTPMASHSFGSIVREQIKGGRFTPQELARLLAAMAGMRAASPSYRPCQYDVADICGGLLGAGLQELGAPQLRTVAASLGALAWPLYQCCVPLLEAAAQEAVRRLATGEATPPACEAVVAAALASARALNPRIGTDLEAQVAGWRAQARVATGGNILRFADAAPAAVPARR